ncbi:phage portal protein [Clostridium tagluense]|uniref:phage portal protein n=1 Tax=Clostridium tagluense TaxID=360422 RepID=UPI001CF1DC93|nr:phage portal protein [Clostridium tagluense]MCB2300648.1 phage portal protein [Clostridium tagluense]
MGILKNRNETRFKDIKNISLGDPEFMQMFGIDSNTISKEKYGETIYYICLNHLVTTSAKMNRYLYQETIKKGKEKIKLSKWESILNREPNPLYTASSLWGSVELNRIHHGNSYVYIENQGKNKYLWVLPSSEITVYIDNAGIFGENGKTAKSRNNPTWYVWNDSRSKKQYIFNANEIMHFKTHMSEDGMTGLSVKDILKTQMDSLKYSENFQGNLFKNNMFGGKVILQYTNALDDKAKDTLILETERYANSVGSGAFLPIPVGISATTLDMKLTDAEFVELNKLSALQLSACFGIKPNVINDYSKSSYSNSETQQLDFYVNTLQALFKMYNDETTKKLLSIKEKQNNYYIEIDKEILFELDKKTQTEILVKQLNNFAITPNEAREKLGYAYVEDANADKLFGNGNLISLEMAGQGANYSRKDKSTVEEVIKKDE